MKIRVKLLLIFFMVGILSVCITGWLGYQNAKTALEKVYFDHLTSIRETKKRLIESYFDQIKNQVLALSEDQMMINAMKEFKKTFYNAHKVNESDENQNSNIEPNLKEYYKNEYLVRLNSNVKYKKSLNQYWSNNDDTIFLQHSYISNNPYPTGSKDLLKQANDKSEYSKVHAKYHPTIQNYLEKFDYYDIFLVDDKTGNIIYSVFKEVDFATSLLTGPYKDTSFAKCFKDAQLAKEKDFVKLADFEPYDPSYAAPASFIASPVFDKNKKIGVLVFQIAIDAINKVMTGNYNWKAEGLGDSGETYIVGTDHKMRNDSRFIIEEPERYFSLLSQIGTDEDTINFIKSYSTSILSQTVQTDAAMDALNGNTNTKIIKDYRGISVLSSYAPLNIMDVQWVILSEIDTKEAFHPVYILRNKILSIMVIISLAVLIFGWIFSKTISNPILNLINSMKNVRKNNFDERVEVVSKDELGVLTVSFNEMVIDLKESRNNLRDSNYYIENIINSMMETLIVLTPDTIIKSVNNAACRLLGYAPHEFIGKSVNKLFANEELTFKGTNLDNLFKEGHLNTIEKSFKTKDAQIIPVDFSCSVMHHNNGKIQGIVCIAQDITERKRVESHIRKLHRAVEQCPSLIVITNTKGNIEYVNPKFTQITGYTNDEVNGKNMSLLKSGNFQQHIYRKLWDNINKGEEWKGELKNKKKNGELYWELASISPIRDPQNTITHFIKAAEDITLRKIAEEKLKTTHDQLVHSEKLAAVGRLSASLAHEFNNPIFGIRNVLERIKNKITIDDNTLEFVNMAIRECNRVTDLIRNLQDFNRPSSGLVKYTDIHESIEEMLMLLAKDISSRNILLEKDYVNDIPKIKVIGDQIKQVLLNLLKNASEAIPEDGGTIKICTKLENTNILIIIQDSGHGITSKHIKHIFEPFFTTKSEVKGTGLGLSVSYGIIKKHGGEIIVKSDKNSGTTFTIILPTKIKEEEKERF